MQLSAPKARNGSVGATQATLWQTTGSVIVALLFTVALTATARRIGLAVETALTWQVAGERHKNRATTPANQTNLA